LASFLPFSISFEDILGGVLMPNSLKSSFA